MSGTGLIGLALEALGYGLWAMGYGLGSLGVVSAWNY